jgi:hypothetical protein
MPQKRSASVDRVVACIRSVRNPLQDYVEPAGRQAARFSEALACLYPTSRHHIPEYSSHTHGGEDFKARSVARILFTRGIV